VVWGGVVVWSVALVTSLFAAEGGQTTPRAEAAKLKNPNAANAASVATGQQLFQKYCRFCHGATGLGDSPMAPKDMKPSNLADGTWDRGSSDGEIFVVIQEGAGPDFKMKGLKGKVSDADAWHIVNYVRSLGGVKK
jgi:mono/diheme cytochrome c family protein